MNHSQLRQHSKMWYNELFTTQIGSIISIIELSHYHINHHYHLVFVFRIVHFLYYFFHVNELLIIHAASIQIHNEEDIES